MEPDDIRRAAAEAERENNRRVNKLLTAGWEKLLESTPALNRIHGSMRAVLQMAYQIGWMNGSTYELQRDAEVS